MNPDWFSPILNSFSAQANDIKLGSESVKVLLSLYKENTKYWLPIIHSFGFRAEEGYPPSLSYSKNESGSNDILYIL